MTRTFPDAAVFIYAAGRDHPLRKLFQEILKAVGSGEIVATTSVEVIQDLLHVLSRRGSGTERIGGQKPGP